MKMVQTLSSVSATGTLYDSAYGWFAPEYHLMSWMLSSLLLKSQSYNTILYADKHAASVLADDLELPYSDVVILPPYKTHQQLWAYPKIVTYSLQEEPFLHVDGDVFIFKSFDPALLSQGLIAQNPETATEYYGSMQKQLLQKAFWLPPAVRAAFEKKEPIAAVNAGILGGTDVAFFKEYAALAKQYVSENFTRLPEIDVNKFNVFYEQHLFHALAGERGKQVSYLFNECFEDNQYRGFGSFWQVPAAKTYLHLIGGYKRNSFYCSQMAFTLRKLFPDHYYRLIELYTRSGGRLAMNYYRHINSYGSETLRHYMFASSTAYITKSFPGETKLARRPLNAHLSEGQAYASRFVNDEEFTCRNAEGELINREVLHQDLDSFLADLTSSLSNLEMFHPEYLYGRDLASAGWFASVFLHDDGMHRKLERCRETAVVTSRFDWGQCFQHLAPAETIASAEDLHFLKEGYHALIVAEPHQNGFSVNELDAFQFRILSLLDEPRSVEEIWQCCKSFFDEEVLSEAAGEARQFTSLMIEQLILNKAVKPL